DVIDFTDLPQIEDVDDMTIALTAGESVDVAISGIGDHFDVDTLELLDSTGTVLATGSSTYYGNLIGNFDQGILGFIIPADGTYGLRVRGTRSMRYELLVTRELAIELEAEAPSAIRSLDGTTGALGSLSDRPSLSGYSHYNNPSLFVDISQTGAALFFDHGDGVAPVYTRIGNSLIPAGKLLVGNDGALMMDEDIDAFSGYSHQGLPSFAFAYSALVPFWADLDDGTGAVYFEEQVVDGVPTLIVQWHNRSYFFGSSGGTFQVQLFDRDPSAARQLAARFVYSDLNFDDPAYNNGASATVGVQLDHTSAELVSFDTAAISDGDVIDFFIELGDRFPLELESGETVTLHTLTPLDGTNIVPPNLLDPGIAILDELGNILASDSNSVDGKNAGLEFTAAAAGNYRIAIYAEGGHGEYVIQTTPGESLRDGDFDNNGQYQVSDVDLLLQRIQDYSQDPVFDLTGDRRVDVTDLANWLSEAGAANLPSQSSYLPGDANLDGRVDGSDFNVWNANKFRATGRWSLADFNADGVTDGADFNIWNANKFLSSDFAAAPAVPVDLSARDGLFARYRNGLTERRRGARIVTSPSAWLANSPSLRT
ncbi:MAG TPA: PPC domain-containing protein, partial [Pirellulaceae bacterium]